MIINFIKLVGGCHFLFDLFDNEGKGSYNKGTNSAVAHSCAVAFL